MERPRLRPHASAHRKSYSLPLSQPSSHVESQTKREKFGHEMFARLKQAKEEVKDGVRMMVEVIKDEAKPMKVSKLSLPYLPGGHFCSHLFFMISWRNFFGWQP
jgi:hypothetical protein